MRGHTLFERGQSAVDEKVTDVALRRLLGRARRGVTRQINRSEGHFAFTAGGALGQAFHHMAVVVAGSEVHRGIDACRVLAQDLLHMTHGLDEGAPVHAGQRAQTTDAVADGHLISGLLLGFELHQPLDVVPGFRQRLLHPGQRQRQCGPLALQPPREFGHKGAGHGRARARHVGHGEHHALGVALGDFGHAIGPLPGHVAVAPFGHHPHRNPAQILDQP